MRMVFDAINLIPKYEINSAVVRNEDKKRLYGSVRSENSGKTTERLLYVFFMR